MSDWDNEHVEPDTNVGYGVVPCKPNCRCRDCQIMRLEKRNADLRTEVQRLEDGNKHLRGTLAAQADHVEQLENTLRAILDYEHQNCQKGLGYDVAVCNIVKQALRGGGG